MKVAILSMQRVVNFGSFMQAFALKEMIESLGHDVTFLDYKHEPDVANKDNFKLKLLTALRETALWKQQRKLRGIKPGEQEIKYNKSLRLLGMSEKRLYRKKADVLVIGSDEVFNCTQPGTNVGYSLELFGKNNRAKKLVSYAASFGNTTIQKLRDYSIDKEISELLNRFDDISVRDNNSYDIVMQLCGISPKIHFDPVLVGNLESIPIISVEYEKYVAIYGYANRFTEEEGKAIQKFAHSRGLKTVSLYDRQDFCDKNLCLSPEEIISYINKAEYVITDTFHGSIFSIIRHKQFVSFCRCKNSIGSTNAEKLEDMLDRVGLSERIVTNLNDMETILDMPINYREVDNIRKAERKRAIEYLASVIK